MKIEDYTSPLCSCIVCREIKSAKGIHRHHEFAHTKIGRETAISIGKIAQTEEFRNKNSKKFKDAKDIKIIEYAANPKYCAECGSELNYDQRRNKFCNKSCRTKFINKNRPHGFKFGPPKFIGPRQPNVNIGKTKEITVINITQCVVCGKWKPKGRKTCSESCLSKILSDTAKNNPMLGGNKNTRAFGWYESIIAGRVYLESSYEHKVAMELDKHNIKWNRPKYLRYDNRKYYPDFYLIDYDVFLDPKNDYLITCDREKIDKVIDQNNVRVLILNKNQLTWEAINLLLSENFEISTP